MGSVYSRKLDVPGTVRWHRGQMAQEWPIFILLNALTLQNRVATCKLPCGNCFWHTLAPKPYPGSVWRRPEWSVPKLSWSMLWQCNSGDTQAPVSGNTPRYRLPYRHRQNWTLLPHSWLSLGQECYGPFCSFFFSTQWENGSASTHPPWQSLAKCALLNETYRSELLWAEEDILPLEPLSPLLTSFTFMGFFYTHQSYLHNHTMKTQLSVLTCTSLAAQSGLTWQCRRHTLLCVPLWVPLGDACCPFFCAWTDPHVSDYMSLRLSFQPDHFPELACCWCSCERRGRNKCL